MFIKFTPTNLLFYYIAKSTLILLCMDYEPSSQVGDYRYEKGTEAAPDKFIVV